MNSSSNKPNDSKPKDSKPRVSFSNEIIEDTHDNVEQFFTNLVDEKSESKNEISIIEITNMLKKVLENQDKILSLLKPKEVDKPTFPSFPE